MKPAFFVMEMVIMTAQMGWELMGCKDSGFGIPICNPTIIQDILVC